MYPLFSRRKFITHTAAGSIGLLGSWQALADSPLLVTGSSPDLYTLSRQLVQTWGAALLSHQVTDAGQTDNYGGILCPGYHLVHGRVGDAIYPFLHLARQTNDHRYVEGAVLLYRWMERRVSQEDGSWLNEPVKGAWKGTTIFTIIALCDALHHHGTLLDQAFVSEVKARLKKAGDYVYKNFSLEYGNINYPVAASYGLTLLGQLLDIPAYKAKGREFAHQAIRFFTPKNGLLYGEGDLYQASAKGCYAIDLGYNVEESLPSLVQYGLLTNDEVVLEPVVRSLQAHMEFMLPDGGWDNSWGTRNFKWTYWGSRTSDGCQPAYALLADRDPRFARVAGKNAEQLLACTHNGLLYGGPHYVAHQVPVSIHHTFCHIKALTMILDQPPVKPAVSVSAIRLPREEVYGVRAFEDIQTWLISQGGFRATVTGYDKDYKKTTNGHATGGALTMLWHEKTGPLLAASMNEYQLFEAGNMQPDTDPLSMPLTPRIAWKTADGLYLNCSDQAASISLQQSNREVRVSTQAQLVDRHQDSPVGGAIRTRIDYRFTKDKLECRYTWDETAPDIRPQIIIPLIAKNSERLIVQDDHTLFVEKGAVRVRIKASRPIRLLPTTQGRVFNFVPGFEAIPLALEGPDTEVTLEIL
ncbi:hypothetical protein [Paraflavitalea pollutisoli]|uniref:hypothetical protein n=1 Tax=Paraflavitalea pollutisoli TaxID=3034143 RepID=UPI0023ECE4EB|nr:hypothetical protein [Paraflavitalea sp. H1-2-19X]